MIQDQHPSSKDIEKTLKDMNAQWKDLYEKSMDKGHKLRQAADQHSLNKALADAQVMMVCHFEGNWLMLWGLIYVNHITVSHST